jgi:hypothetical protein
LANAAAGDSSRPQVAAAAAAVEAAALAAFLAGVLVEAAVWHAGHAGGPDTKTATTATPHAPAGASPGAAVAPVEAGAGAAAVAGSNAPRLLPLATLQPYAYAPAPARGSSGSSGGSGRGGWAFLGPALRARAAAGLQPITAPACDGSGGRAPLIQVPLYRTTAASARLPSGLGAGSVGGRSGARSSEADVLASLPGSALVLGAAVFVGAVPSSAVAEIPTKALNQPTRRGSF